MTTITRGDTPAWRLTATKLNLEPFPLQNIRVFFTAKKAEDVSDAAAFDPDDEESALKHRIAFDADGVVDEATRAGFHVGVWDQDAGEYVGGFAGGIVTHLIPEADSTALDAGEYVFDYQVVLQPDTPHQRVYTFYRHLALVVDPDVTRRITLP